MKPSDPDPGLDGVPRRGLDVAVANETSGPLSQRDPLPGSLSQRDPLPGSLSQRDPLPELTLIHHHPGRLRVRAAAFQAGEVAARVVAGLEGVPGITTVKHNPRTGSILVEYEPGVAHAETILGTIADASGLSMPGELARRPREPGVIAIGLAREVNDIVHEVTGYRADLRTIVPAGMAALAAYSWLTHPEARLPRWDNLLYWSYNIFSQLHRRELEEGSPQPPAWRHVEGPSLDGVPGRGPARGVKHLAAEKSRSSDP